MAHKDGATVPMLSRTAVIDYAAVQPAHLVETFAAADVGLSRQERLAEEVDGATRLPLLLTWRAPRALIVGRSDARLPHFVEAAERLLVEGWPVLLRRSGGGACPVSRGTLQIAIARPVTAATKIDAGYRELGGLVGAVLAGYGLTPQAGEIGAAFCPGRYDISLDGRKIAGLSQHWRRCNGRPTVTTSATLVVEEDLAEFARIVNLFYTIAGGKQRCAAAAIGCVRQALRGAILIRGEALIGDLGARLTAAARKSLEHPAFR